MIVRNFSTSFKEFDNGFSKNRSNPSFANLIASLDGCQQTKFLIIK